MTKIKKAEREAIETAMYEMGRRICAQTYMPKETFINLFFTAKQREQLEAVYSFVDISDTSTTKASFATPSTIPDDLPLPEGTERECSVPIRANYGNIGLAPRKWVFHPNAAPEDIAEFHRCVEEITLRGNIKAMWENIMVHYTKRAASHEEMRYLFPGTVTILRHAGLHEVANKVESVKRRPNVYLGGYLRSMFRYMNQWFAVQTMMDTFTGPYHITGALKDHDTVTLYLTGRVIAGNGFHLMVP